ncbi:MAG: hypothetical protein C4576_11315 [Desulfobacteraceae bacterium]|nr:MAG: hypothetical protein C4576_11315 [Desulfobacteraceae bacterium]
MTASNCRKYDTCNAPLCPLDEQSLKCGIWYPDEEVCAIRDYVALPWVQSQRKILMRAGRTDRYFTLSMLERNCIVKGGIEGLDPDETEEPQLKKWLRAHPEKKALSDKDRERIGRRLARSRSGSRPEGATPQPPAPGQ